MNRKLINAVCSLAPLTLLSFFFFFSLPNAKAGYFYNVINTINGSKTISQGGVSKNSNDSQALKPEGINGSCKLPGVDLKALYAQRIDHLNIPEHAAMLKCLEECNSESCIEQRREWWTIAKPYNQRLLECNSPACHRITSIFNINGLGDFLDYKVLSRCVIPTGPGRKHCFYTGMGTATIPNPENKKYPRVINSNIGCFIVSKKNPKEVIAGPFKCPEDYKSSIKVIHEW